MKDEEMAEEWVRTKHNILKDCLSACVRAEHKNEIQAFLDGLKAGRPQWHDLRKDPSDLPEARPLNWVVAVYDGGTLWCRARREKCVDGVYWVNSYHHIIENVVMWAKIEIPTFDKE